ALAQEELLFVLTRHWRRLGRTLDPEDFTDAQSIAAIERITRGNFRLLERLFPQIGRVLKINQLDTITDDVIEAAASTLVTGSRHLLTYSSTPLTDQVHRLRGCSAGCPAMDRSRTGGCAWRMREARTSSCATCCDAVGWPDQGGRALPPPLRTAPPRWKVRRRGRVAAGASRRSSSSPVSSASSLRTTRGPRNW